jgi:hypothetical protein
MKKNFFLLIILLLFSFISCDRSEDTTQSKNDQIDYSTLQELNLPKDNITLKIDGESLELTTPIYLEKNRYYLCLTEIIDKLKGNLKEENDTLIISMPNSNLTIDLATNTTLVNNTTYTLKKPLIEQENFYYIGFSDLAYLLNLYTRWDVNSKTIICKTNGDKIENLTPYTSKIDQVGYLRLEDITLTTLPEDNYNLEKLRIMANYLSKKNVPYHIAWIPRFIGGSIDVDPMTRNDFTLAQLVYTLDYFSQHNGSIGLHGYTHQFGNEASAVGTEFGHKHPSTDMFREKIVKAIKTAEYLSIPIDFFETPHYEITQAQNKIAEEYFKILYHSFKDKSPSYIDFTKPQLSPYNNSSYYIATPLDYIPENKIDSSIEALKHANEKNMGSLFFHPYLDFKFITLSENEGIPTYNYDDNSILKRVIDSLEVKGFKMSKVTDIK